MENVVIIGSGPAGLTAGIYTSRAGLKPILLTGMQTGGQLTTTSIIENFPGFPKGVDGNELMQNMQAQAEEMGTRVVHGSVEKIEKLPQGGFRLVTDGDPIETKAVIVATGASALTLDLPNKQKLMGFGLSTCAVCDGFFYRNKKVAVVGGGDSALEEALYLSKLASEVTLVVRRDKFRASKAMQEKVLSNPKVRVAWNSQVVDTLSNAQGLTGIVLQSSQGARSELTVDGLFMAIGHKPNTDFLVGLVELDETGYVLTHGGTQTSVPGIFAAGDVEDKLFRQAITASGRGCQAALQVEKFVEGIALH
jgi:thioredoxin reductase (NADPH)